MTQASVENVFDAVENLDFCEICLKNRLKIADSLGIKREKITKKAGKIIRIVVLYNSIGVKGRSVPIISDKKITTERKDLS